MSWRKNKSRRELIERFGEEAGLPLFAGESDAKVPKHVQARLETSPKAIQTADETRKLAHITINMDELKLGEKQQRILDLMCLRDDWTNEEIAHKLGWGVNRVVGRVFELRELGLVIPALRRACSITGMIVQAWRVK